MKDPQRFREQAYISVERNCHAAHTLRTFPANTKPEVYEGEDIDADVLDKPPGSRGLWHRWASEVN